MLEENLHYTIALGKKIGAKEISGFNYAHYSQYVGGMVPKNFINFNFFQDYFYIGSNIPQSGSKGTTIWFEWFYPHEGLSLKFFEARHYNTKLGSSEQIDIKKRRKQRKDAAIIRIDANTYKGKKSVGFANFEEVRVKF